MSKQKVAVEIWTVLGADQANHVVGALRDLEDFDLELNIRVYENIWDRAGALTDRIESFIRNATTRNPDLIILPHSYFGAGNPTRRAIANQIRNTLSEVVVYESDTKLDVALRRACNIRKHA